MIGGYLLGIDELREPNKFLGNPNDYDINPEYIDYLNNKITDLKKVINAYDDYVNTDEGTGREIEAALHAAGICKDSCGFCVAVEN